MTATTDTNGTTHTNGTKGTPDTAVIPPTTMTFENGTTHAYVQSPESIPFSEFQARIAAARAALGPANLLGLVSFGDCWRGANICYFTDFRPLDGVSDIANAIFFLPLSGEPALFVSAQCLDYATEVTSFPVHPFSALSAHLSAFAALHAASPGTLALAGDYYLPHHLHTLLTTSLAPHALTPHPLLSILKSIKTPLEIALIRRASALTDIAMSAIREALATGEPHTERQLALLADRAMLAAGADRTAYDSMVQSGPRSAFNLARPTDRLVSPGDLVMTDIGARYRGYVADGGRGFAFGPVSPEKRAIVRAAAATVEAGLAALRPGITADDLNRVMQASLVKSGFERYSSEARGHGTGHGTGMDPEEEAPWIGPGNATVLRAGMVFTLKATITVPGVGGLRTERIVRVTEDGGEALDVFPMELFW